jgi:hypothetical protein
METRYTGTIRCPYCGAVNEYTNETCFTVNDDDLTMRCRVCGNEIEPKGDAPKPCDTTPLCPTTCEPCGVEGAKREVDRYEAARALDAHLAAGGSEPDDEPDQPCGAEGKKIRFLVDPLNLPLQVADELYPGKLDGVVILFTPNLKAEQDCVAQAQIPDDGSPAVIWVAAEAPIDKVSELLVHEIAHVIVGAADGDGHNAKWLAVSTMIFDEVNRQAQVIIQQAYPDAEVVESHE